MNDCSRLLVLAAMAVSTVLSACGDSSESVATTTLPPPTAEEQCWGKLSDVVFDYFNTRDADPLIDIAGSENGVLVYFTYAIGNAVQVRYASGDDAAAESLHASVTEFCADPVHQELVGIEPSIPSSESTSTTQRATSDSTGVEQSATSDPTGSKPLDPSRETPETVVMLFVQAWMTQDFEAAALYGTEGAVEGVIMQKVPTPDLTTIECNQEFCVLTDVDPNERDYYVIFDPNTHEVQNAGQDKPVCIRADIDFAALRSEPNLDAELLVEMPAGSCRGVFFSDAIASGNGFDWYQLRWNGIEGWVAASNLQGA